MSSPPERDVDNVEPPYTGIVVTLLDALIIFEASRRGLIPRITRRLAEKERAGMISSGSVFVFDEGESGIKRWTDGRIWSPSRILSNFLVYRETDKRADRHNPLPAGPKSPPKGAAKPKPRKSPPSAQPDGTPATIENASSSTSTNSRPPLAKVEPDSPNGSFALPLSAQGESGSSWASAHQPHGGSSDGGDSLEMDFGELASGAVAGIELGSPTKLGQQELVDEADESRQSARLSEKARERQLVGSLTNTYRFKENGLIKKTISVTINGVSQHLVSYYSMEDALSGRLRSPSTVPELFALDISPDYLSNKHFRFPPKVEIGPDGVHRYRGEPDEPQSPPLSAMSMESSSSSTRAPASKAKRDADGTQPARRGSKASTSSGGHNVSGPSTDTWQQSTPQSWSGRPGSPMRQSARPIRPAGMQRRASEQVDYPSSMVSPRWNGNQQQLQDHQLQHQQQQQHGLQGYAIPGPSSHRHPSPSAPTSSSYQPPSTFHHEMQYQPSQPQMYAPPTYPDTMPSVLARPSMEPRRQSLAVGMERTGSSEGAQYGVSPGRSSFQSSRNMRNFHPYAPTNDGTNGGGEPLQFTQPTRRNSDFPTARRGSPPPPLAGLPIQPGQTSPPEETPPLEAEADYTQYSYTPSFESHNQPSTPLNGQPPSHHPHPYHHPQYQLPQDPSPYYQPAVTAAHAPSPAPESYSTHPHPQSTYTYPPQGQQPLYYDPNGRGPPQQAYDPYGRPVQPTTMDPYAFQHVQHQAVDQDPRYASGMVAGGAGVSAVSSLVKEEAGQEQEGYAWGFAGVNG